jgi:hypothetical protein
MGELLLAHLAGQPGQEKWAASFFSTTRLTEYLVDTVRTVPSCEMRGGGGGGGEEEGLVGFLLSPSRTRSPASLLQTHSLDKVVHLLCLALTLKGTHARNLSRWRVVGSMSGRAGGRTREASSP